MSLSKKSYDNCKYLFKPPSVGGAGEKSDEENKYIDFKEYVDAPIGYGPFDIILIDGRARVACASKCHLLGHKNTIVFIHDFTTPDSPYYNPTRDYYVKSLEYLEYIENTMTIAKFKIKNL